MDIYFYIYGIDFPIDKLNTIDNFPRGCSIDYAFVNGSFFYVLCSLLHCIRSYDKSWRAKNNQHADRQAKRGTCTFLEVAKHFPL